MHTEKRPRSVRLWLPVAALVVAAAVGGAVLAVYLPSQGDPNKSASAERPAPASALLEATDLPQRPALDWVETTVQAQQAQPCDALARSSAVQRAFDATTPSEGWLVWQGVRVAPKDEQPSSAYEDARTALDRCLADVRATVPEGVRVSKLDLELPEADEYELWEIDLPCRKSGGPNPQCIHTTTSIALARVGPTIVAMFVIHERDDNASGAADLRHILRVAVDKARRA